MNTISLERDGIGFLEWSRNNPVGQIPRGVAKEGAGENRIPFAHLANSVPVYLTLLKNLIKINRDNCLILDVGCGTGRNITFVKDTFNNNAKFYGIDYSKHCIDFAKNQYGSHGVYFKQHNGENIPFEDNKFDYIVSSHVLEHIPKGGEIKYFSEISRILKTGGMAVIGTPNRKYCQNLFYKNPREVGKYRLILPHLHEYTYQELNTLLKNNKWFSSYAIDQTINKINRKLMTDSIDKIKPKKDIFSKMKFELYSLLRKNSQLQDIMAKVGTEFILRNMKVSYEDLVKNTFYVRGSKKDFGDNFIIIARK